MRAPAVARHVAVLTATALTPAARPPQRWRNQSPWGRRPWGLSEPAAVCLGGTLDREPATGPDCARPRQSSSCPYQNARFDEPCSQVLHLEYRLDAVPSVRDSLALQLGDRIGRSRWTRP